jgi:glycosyltransferase involved in cell wall biosynthesis
MFKSNSIWFWQRILTPHMAALASELANRGFKVTFVANSLLSSARAKQGWETPSLGKAKLILAKNKENVISIASDAPRESIHICQGLRGNGLIKHTQKILRKRGLKYWVLMEMIDDEGVIGVIKRIIYNFLFLRWQKNLVGVLAIGQKAIGWFIDRGMRKDSIYSFAYFLDRPKIDNLLKLEDKEESNRSFRFVFVGRLVKLKKIDLLIKSIASLKMSKIELWVIGSGPEEKYLRSIANSLMPNQVCWLGTLPISEVPIKIRQTDCLVLPSRYDGWGAVVCESLMVGTPVICSDACGSSEVVEASGVGGIFLKNDQRSLTGFLYKQYKLGQLNDDEKQKIIEWAKCLSAESGAEYLDLILNNDKKELVEVPWLK